MKKIADVRDKLNQNAIRRLRRSFNSKRKSNSNPVRVKSFQEFADTYDMGNKVQSIEQSMKNLEFRMESMHDEVFKQIDEKFEEIAKRMGITLKPEEPPRKQSIWDIKINS